MIDYSRFYRAYKEMLDTLDGDFAKGYIVGGMSDNDKGEDVHAGNAYNRIIDLDWVEAIEEALPYMDKAIRQDRKFIETIEEVERIDKVKKIGKESVRHLTQHTNFIQKVEGDEVTPAKLLNIRREESYHIYENRFLYTLIHRTIAFVEARFRAMQEAPTDSYNKIEMRRDVALNNQKFNFAITYSIETHEREKIDKDADVSTLSDFERIARIRMMLNDFVHSPLMMALTNCIQVRSPINKTNCIKKDPAFKKCYELWVFIESYQKTGYIVENNEYSGNMEDSLKTELYNVMAFQHFIMQINTNSALRQKLQDEYEAENERRAKEALKPDEERERYLEEQIYEVRREEMAIRLKEIRERELIIAKLTTELEQEKEKVRQRDMKIKELRAELELKEKELVKTKDELRAALLRVAELEAELEAAKARIKELEEIVARQAKEIEEKKAKIAQLEKTVEKQRIQIEQLTDENNKLKQRVKELENLVSELSKEITELKAKIVSLENTIEIQKDKIQSLNEEIKELNATIDALNEKVKEQEATIKEHLATISRLSDNVASLEKSVSALTGENSQLKSTVNTQSHMIDELNNNVDSLNNRLERCKNDIDELNHIKATNESLISDQKKSIEELSKQRDSLEKDKFSQATVIRGYEEKIGLQTQEIKDVNSRLDSANDLIKANNKQIDNLKNDVARQTSIREKELEKLENRRQKDLLRVQNEHSSNLKKAEENYKKQVKQLENEKNKAYSVEESKFNARLKQLEKQMKQEYNSKIAKMQSECDRKVEKSKQKAKQFVKLAKQKIKSDPQAVLDAADNDYKNN